ncbi:reverse transcriptase [Plakobranchus ocellatus]|uniref:Reverse transcriptase n=1 Tax=Plakobranchus ocellatus TaxID=259542 RepID=A0AAV4A9Y8_9GAST|nr:reverse transcriptase [Plakobranchus ocellatus]
MVFGTIRKRVLDNKQGNSEKLEAVEMCLSRTMVSILFLFILAIEVILRAAEGNANPADLGGRCFMPPLEAFMVVLQAKETRRMLFRLDALMNWARISFKPKKSQSLSTRKGKLNEDVCFKIARQDIPRISQEPVKNFEDGTVHN